MSMDNQDFFNHVVETKVNIEELTEAISSQLKAKAELIRSAGTENPNAQKWQTEMADLQKRLVTEPEEAMQLLCAGIEERTGSKDISGRNTKAINKKLKGEKWAQYVLGCGEGFTHL